MQFSDILIDKLSRTEYSAIHHAAWIYFYNFLQENNKASLFGNINVVVGISVVPSQWTNDVFTTSD